MAEQISQLIMRGLVAVVVALVLLVVLVLQERGALVVLALHRLLLVRL
jgi:hypothetical protein